MATQYGGSDGGDLGRLVLRVALGTLLLMHGVAKVKGGVDQIIGLITQHGLPVFVAFGVYVGEVIAPFLLIVGLYTRAAALIVVINMVFAILLVHTGSLLALNPQGGWAIELEGIYLFAALAVMLLGAGRYSLGGNDGRAN